MNGIAGFVQRTETAARFRRALLIFWLPLILAAALPAVYTVLTQSLEIWDLLFWGGIAPIWTAYAIGTMYEEYGMKSILVVFAIWVGAGALILLVWLLVWLLASVSTSMRKLTENEKAALLALWIYLLINAGYFAHSWARSHAKLEL